MKIYLIKKKKNRKYISEKITAAILSAEGLSGSLKHDVNGRPFIEAKACANAPEISISDTKNYWTCVLSNQPCGIDIEEAKGKDRSAVVKRLNELEKKYLEPLSPGSSEFKSEFLSVWTRKEAYMKLCGLGISMGLSSFSTIGEDLSFENIIRCKDRPDGYIYTPSLASDLSCAVCLAAPERFDGIIEFTYEGEIEKTALDASGELLSARAYTSAELSKKLKDKGYGDDEISSALDTLKELSYLDDEGFAQSYAIHAAERGLGKMRISNELSKKGADRSAIKSALNKLAEDESQLSERERAMAQALKILRLEDTDFSELSPDQRPDEKSLNKLGRRLAALGYEASVIYDILGKLR